MKTSYSYYFKLSKDKQRQITMFTRKLVYVPVLQSMYPYSSLCTSTPVYVPVLQSMYT